MADYNNNSRRPLLAEKRLLALAALEVVRRHDVLRMTELNSHVLELTSELAIVRNERNESRAEMDRRRIIIHGSDRLSNRPEGAVGVQGNEDLVVDDQGFDIGMENRHPADDIFALAMDIQQITTRMTEVISHIDELNDELADVTSERDQMRDYLNGDGWGRFRLLPRDVARTGRWRQWRGEPLGE
jgi:hypothetical protein